MSLSQARLNTQLFDTSVVQRETCLAINFIVLHRYASSLPTHCLNWCQGFISLEQRVFFPGTKLSCEEMDAVNRYAYPAGRFIFRGEGWTSSVQNRCFDMLLSPTTKVKWLQSMTPSVFLAGSSFSISTDVHSGELFTFPLFICFSPRQ